MAPTTGKPASTRKQASRFSSAHRSPGRFVANEVQFAYDDFGQIVTEYQEHAGAVNTGTSLKVQYAYADGSSNTIRMTKMTYPNGRELNYNYGTSGSTDDALSRVASLIDNDGTTHLVDYSYLGRNTFVKTDYPEPDLRYDLAMGAGDDPYDGLDRFGRIVDSRWYDYGSSADVDRIKYGYDRAGNRTFREQTCDPNSNHDEVYGHDGVNRLTDFDRGTINGNKDAISTLKFAQQWSLDPTGNWSGFKEDSDGDSMWDLEQSRTSNEVNEITDITETSGTAWATPVYDRAGNMTTIPKPGDPTSSFAATYDAWNRLVKLGEGANTVAEYVYDGAKRCVVKKTYNAGALDEMRHFFYTDPEKWQVIEERLESGGTISATPDRQFIWGQRYIDDFGCRDRDTDSNGNLDERLYGLQDANWNVTALADTSGDAQERYAYTAYGTPRFLTPMFATRAASSYGAEVLYAGYRYDSEGGLFYIRNRVLDAAIGIWTQRDPLEYEDGANLFSYSDSAPLGVTDPFGLATNICDCCNKSITGQTYVDPNTGEVRQDARLRAYEASNGNDCDIVLTCKELCNPPTSSGTCDAPVKQSSGRYRIDICISCQLADKPEYYEATIAHEMDHAKRLCQMGKAAGTCQECLTLEREAYKISCMMQWPTDGRKRMRCIACGVYFSCRKFNTPGKKACVKKPRPDLEGNECSSEDSRPPWKASE